MTSENPSQLTPTATFVRHLEDFAGDARLYKVDPPMESRRWADDEDEKVRDTTDYVVVSAAVAMRGPETYIFPANAAGDVTDWGGMEGSFRGALDHDRALAGAGYEVALDG